MKKVLIVVDMQNDFCYNMDVLGSEAAQKIVPNVVAKVKNCRENGDLIFFTKDNHNFDYLTTREGKHLPIEHCISGTEGAELIKDLQKIGGIEIYKDDQFGLNAYDIERKIDSVFDYHADIEFEIIGIATNLCVLSVAVTLQNYFNNAEITIDASCCASYDPILHEKALDVMEGLQFNVINR